MAEKIPEDYTIARKYIRCVLRWFKAEIDYCLDCDRYFIRGQQKQDGEEVRSNNDMSLAELSCRFLQIAAKTFRL